MTRKDFALIAEVIADEGRFGAKEHPVRISTLRDVAESFASVLASENPRFDRSRFLAACELPVIGEVIA